MGSNALGWPDIPRMGAVGDLVAVDHAHEEAA